MSPFLFCGLMITVQASNEVIATREATCAWAEQAPTIDGKLDEPCWTGAPAIDRFPSFWARLPSTGSTVARLIWDDQALYFGATMTDRELRSFGTRRNDHLWNGDVFELFFKPDRSKPAYYEFQANPKGVILEIPFPERGYSFEELAARPPMGTLAITRIVGTLDQPGDLDVSWTVEGKIPWTAFASTGGKPAPGARWTFALCRYDYGKEGTMPLLTSSAPLSKPNFHLLEDYGQLMFQGPKVNK